MMKRTALLAAASLLIGLGSVPILASERPGMEVKKTATCGCCAAWIDQLRAAGFQVQAENLPFGILAKFKTKNGVPNKLASCHTAKIGGYVIEGHVPIREIDRLLKEKPDAIGLTVPGMPLGSPGMEAGDTREAYDVLLINRDGTTRVFAHYPAKE